MANTRFQIENGLYVTDSGEQANVVISIPTRVGSTFEVDGATKLDSTLLVTGGDATFQQQVLIEDNLTVRTNALHVDTNGKVGIGTTSTDSKLKVAGSANVTGNVAISDGLHVSVQDNQQNVFTVKWANTSEVTKTNAVSITDNGDGGQSNIFFSGNTYWNGDLHIVDGTLRINQDFIILGDQVTQGNELYAANLVASTTGLWVGGGEPQTKTLSFTFANPSTISATGNNLTVFKAGNRIQVSGTNNNDGFYTVASSTTTSITINETSLVNEGPVSCTISTEGFGNQFEPWNLNAQVIKLYDNVYADGPNGTRTIGTSANTFNLYGYNVFARNSLSVRDGLAINVHSTSSRVGIGGPPDGAKQLKVTGAATITTNLDVDGTFDVDGVTTLSTTTVSGLLTVENTAPRLLIKDTQAGNSADPYLRLANSSADMGQIGYISTNNSDLSIRNISDSNIKFEANDVEYMRLQNDGDLSISERLLVGGTVSDSPDATLQVVGTANVSDAVAIGGVLTGYNDLVVRTNKLKVTTNGVGIGTDPASGRALNVNGDSYFGSIIPNANNTVDIGTAGLVFLNIYGNDIRAITLHGDGNNITNISPTSHTHNTFDRATSVLSSAAVFSDIVVADGIVTAISTRDLTIADLGGSYDRTSSALTGAAVFSDIVVADGLVTGTTTRNLTASNIGALSSSTSSTQSGYFGNIYLRDDTNASHYLAITVGEDLTAAKTLTLVTGNSNRTLTFTADTTIGGTHSGSSSGTNTGDQIITSSNGITGGSAVAGADVTLSLDFTDLTDMTADIAGTTEFILNNAGTESRKAASEIKLSKLLNDSGWTSNIGDITGVTAGTGLSGGGTSGTVSLALDFSELTDMTGDISGTTEFILQNGTTESRKAASEIKLSNFSNDSGWTSNIGDITAVYAGSGLTGGATSGDATLNVVSTTLSVTTDAVNLTSGIVTAGTSGSATPGATVRTITTDTYGRVTGRSQTDTGDNAYGARHIFDDSPLTTEGAIGDIWYEY